MTTFNRPMKKPALMLAEPAYFAVLARGNSG